MNTFQYDTVLSTIGHSGVRTIALNRPERLNAMNRSLMDDLARAFAEANADPDTQAIIFTGAGRAFCAGMVEAQTVAEKLSGLPPLAVRAMKRVLNQAAARDIMTALRLETEATVAGFLDPETTTRLKDF